MRVVGIDLAGSANRTTGYCILSKKTCKTSAIKTDEEILERIIADKPKLITMDAPLSLPKGRKSIEHRNNKHYRNCDLELRRLKIPFFPITLGPMRMLTKRGMLLKKKIEKELKIPVIEVYPGATYDLLGAKRKERRSILGLFRKFKVQTNPRTIKTHDELDAIACALTGSLVLQNKHLVLGKVDGRIHIPNIKKLKF